MHVKDRTPTIKQLLPGLILILLGFAAGSLWEPLTHLRRMRQAALKAAQASQPVPVKFAPAPERPAPSTNSLTTLHITLDDAAAVTLEEVRARALVRGQIVQTEADTVPALVRTDGADLHGTVRIKGDWVDHVTSDKWSLRVTLEDGKLLGMRTFSIQNPNTRGWLWEWVVHEAARYEGLLAPRSTFVNVVINNKPQGIYFLEEHFSKELLEAQGRREGPIVLFDESTSWGVYFQNHVGALNFRPRVPAETAPAQKPANAEVRAFGEGRLQAGESLNRALNSALDKMADLQASIIADDHMESRLRKLEALEALQGTSVDRLLDVAQFAEAHALQSLFQIWHGLVWHNLRFYYNPVSDRLEPIIYDNMAHSVQTQEPILFGTDPVVRRLRDSPTYTLEFFENLAVYASGTWLEGFQAKIADDLNRYVAALEAEAPLPPAFQPQQMFQRLRGHQIYLKELMNVQDAVNFQGLLVKSAADNLVDGRLSVRAWATTRLPVVLEGFRFHDGSELSARAALAPSSDYARVLPDGGVVLPADQRAIQLAFPVNRRLATLSNVAEIKRTIRAGAETSTLRLDRITAVYRVAGRETPHEELLHFRVTDQDAANATGRPVLPTLAAALASHDFLHYNAVTDTLSIQPGVHEVQGDLLVPAGYPLHAAAGVVLRFDAANLLYSESPLLFEGSAENPVVLEPREGAPYFSGILVRETETKTHWTHVVVRHTNSFTRGGWAATGGITFYHAPVVLRDCRIEGTIAEDGTNIFGTEFLMERVTFSRCVSDSFDGDFVRGTIRDCTFIDGEADGVDVSGSDVVVENCRFLNLGDKGVSVGENSRCRVLGGEMNNTVIGIASKDLSETTVTGTRFSGVRLYQFAVYTKKAEYGPSRVTASDITVEGTVSNLVQTGSALRIDDTSWPTQDVDVGKMYAEKVLGN